MREHDAHLMCRNGATPIIYVMSNTMMTFVFCRFSLSFVAICDCNSSCKFLTEKTCWCWCFAGFHRCFAGIWLDTFHQNMQMMRSYMIDQIMLVMYIYYVYLVYLCDVLFQPLTYFYFPSSGRCVTLVDPPFGWHCQPVAVCLFSRSAKRLRLKITCLKVWPFLHHFYSNQKIEDALIHLGYHPTFHQQ